MVVVVVMQWMQLNKDNFGDNLIVYLMMMMMMMMMMTMMMETFV